MRNGRCDTCEMDATLYVYALPGVPISVANCRSCLDLNAYPLWIAEANTESIGGIEHAAGWWRASMTWKAGRYVTIEEALR